MAKRMRRTRKRAPRRKRRTRVARVSRSLKTYDQMNITCDLAMDIPFISEANGAQLVWFWRNLNSASTSASISKTDEWNTFLPRFREFKITYAKIRIDSLRYNLATGVWGPIYSGSRTDAINGIPLDLKQLRDAKDYTAVASDFVKPFKKGLNVQKFLKRVSVGAAGWVPVGAANTDFFGTTGINIDCGGFAAGNVVAKALCRWYVSFRGPVS